MRLYSTVDTRGLARLYSTVDTGLARLYSTVDTGLARLYSTADTGLGVSQTNLRIRESPLADKGLGNHKSVHIFTAQELVQHIKAVALQHPLKVVVQHLSSKVITVEFLNV